MPPRPSSLRLPTLTLFTKEGSCSLCDVAKEDLKAIQRVAPFRLQLYDIAKQGPDDDLEYERTAWRRLYQVGCFTLRAPTFDVLRPSRFARSTTSPCCTTAPTTRSTHSLAGKGAADG